MKNYQISPGQIPHLVRLTADLFRKMREEVKSPNHNPSNLRDESTKMHYVVDLLKNLVDTAYPLEDNNDKELICALNLKPLEESDIKNLEKDFQNIAKIMKDYKPPKAGEF